MNSAAFTFGNRPPNGWFSGLRYLSVITLLFVATAARAGGDLGLHFPEGNEDVEIDLVRYGDFLLVPVTINENHNDLFLLDTGSSVTVIDDETAEQIGLERIGEVDAKAYGGGAQVVVSPVDRLDVGGASFLSSFVGRADLGGSRIAEDQPKRYVGLLGMDFLGRVPFTIDFLRAKLVLHHPARGPAGAKAAALTLDVVSSLPRVELQIGRDGVAGSFVIDTGSNHAMQFSGHFASLHYEWIKQLAWTKSIAYGLGGVFESREIVMPRVQGLDHAWEDVPVSYQRGVIDEPSGTAAGHIGVTFLRARVMTVDIARREIWYSRANEQEIDDALQSAERHGVRDVAGSGVLHYAADMGSPALVAEMAARSDLEQADDYGATAISHAARRGDVEVLRALIAAGADINHLTTGGSSPLLIALQYRNPECAEVLLQAGADAAHANMFGATPIIFAAERGYVEIVRSLIDAGVDVNGTSAGFLSALVAATGHGNEEVVRLLLQAGAKTTKLGKVPPACFIAAQAGHTSILKLLIDHGADVKEVSSENKSLLFFAANAGRLDMVDLLLASGLEREDRDTDGKTAFDYALRKGNIDVMRRLYYESSPIE